MGLTAKEYDPKDLPGDYCPKNELGRQKKRN